MSPNEGPLVGEASRVVFAVLVIFAVLEGKWTLWPFHAGGEILNMDDVDGLRGRVETCLGLVGEAIGKGDNILVHCKHGIHRSGSFVVLVLALFLVLHDVYNGNGPHTAWHDALAKAWHFWERRRDLASRSDHIHDYEAESWKAVDDYFGFLEESDAGGLAILLSRGIQRTCGNLRTKAIVNEVAELMPVQSLQSIVNEVPGQSLQSERSQKSQESEQTASRGRSRSPVAVHRRPRPQAKVRPRSKAVPAVPAVPSDPPSPPVLRARSKLAPRPPPVPPPPAALEEKKEFKPRDWICRKCGNLNWQFRGFCNGMSLTAACLEPRDCTFEPGDWYCICGNFNLRHRVRCNRSKCGLEKSEDTVQKGR